MHIANNLYFNVEPLVLNILLDICLENMKNAVREVSILIIMNSVHFSNVFESRTTYFVIAFSLRV